MLIAIKILDWDGVACIAGVETGHVHREKHLVFKTSGSCLHRHQSVQRQVKLTAKLKLSCVETAPRGSFLAENIGGRGKGFS